MLRPINNLPPHVVGIHATGDVTELEYEDVLKPLLDETVKQNGSINFILVLETDIENFDPGLWCGNRRIGLKYFFKWNKVAIVTDQKKVGGYSDLFKYIIPGRFMKFPLDELDKGIRWVSEKR